ncbi:DUF2141 domain-containing protein [Sphingomonas panacisoli]|uniref:DUF2141 domain-containing protein n=1 Tax=Sphingomonas panacisoli TaxID=1813879 RepID=A0A5B8LP28_9SPHN|nr:DUF2141 domain-containing protein [Sphingomonas panacisoli]QDZ09152.1 DUF2141 domain-containing protein [Sphingomonas panacisoli]
MPVALLLLAGTGELPPSTPDLGKAGAPCRPGETGPAAVIEVVGLRDRAGLLKVELYPANDGDFLADDNVLIGTGKVFRRVEVRTPQNGPVTLCIRAPAAGTYAISVLHDRDANHRFGVSIDGIGFSRNPKLGWSKPAAQSVALGIGPKPTRTTIVMNYRRGLFSFGPIAK